MINFNVKWEHGVYKPRFAPKVTKILSYTNNIVKEVEYRNYTKCIITIGSEEFEGKVGLYYKDRENRRVGNKIAFRKATLQIPNKKTRTELWGWFKTNHTKCIGC